ncbi:MAG: pyridoxamine 5'-phosphate oxidase family protein [Candidatus Omnitrophota bacterium]
MLSGQTEILLKKREFLYVATCDRELRPNLAPKFLLKIENNVIYLVDHVIGRTYRNIKENPRICVSFLDFESLVGYQFNGAVETIESGHEHEKLLKEFEKKEIDFSVQRIIDGIEKGRKHEAFEAGISGKAVIFKAVIDEMVEIGPQGSLKKQNVRTEK